MDRPHAYCGKSTLIYVSTVSCQVLSCSRSLTPSRVSGCCSSFNRYHVLLVPGMYLSAQLRSCLLKKTILTIHRVSNSLQALHMLHKQPVWVDSQVLFLMYPSPASFFFFMLFLELSILWFSGKTRHAATSSYSPP